MQIKHHHPPFPCAEQHQQALNHAFTACMKQLRRASPRAPCRPVPGKAR